MIIRLREEMDKSREHELKLIQMLNSGGSATQQQQQYAFQSMPNSGNTQYIENGSIANYSKKWHGSGTFAHYMLSQPEMPHASFGHSLLHLTCHQLQLKTFVMEKYTINCKFNSVLYFCQINWRI